LSGCSFKPGAFTWFYDVAMAAEPPNRLKVRMELFAEARKAGDMPIFVVVGGTGIEPVTPAV
jgi:hypothetical protein